MNTDTYPKFWVVGDTGRPIRQLTRLSNHQGATVDGGWEPFNDVDALMEDTDEIDEEELSDAISKWKD